MEPDVTSHRASCRCGALTAIANGTPANVSVCHCPECQRRSGSAFAAQVRFLDSQVTLTGDRKIWRTIGAGDRWQEFQFCPTCGGHVAYRIEYFPDMIAIPIGTFDDPRAFAPQLVAWERYKHDWVAVTGNLEHFD